MKIDRLNKIILEVTEWERIFLEIFGPVLILSEKGKVVGGRWADNYGPLPFKINPRSLSFRGAALTQELVVTHEKEEAIVDYEAKMRIDENTVLSSLFVQFPILDPEYTLMKLQIRIPRAELIKESLHLVNEKLESGVKAGAALSLPSKRNRLEDYEWLVPLLIPVFAGVPFGIWALASLLH